jgi:hypothetical protein
MSVTRHRKRHRWLGLAAEVTSRYHISLSGTPELSWIIYTSSTFQADQSGGIELDVVSKYRLSVAGEAWRTPEIKAWSGGYEGRHIASDSSAQ